MTDPDRGDTLDSSVSTIESNNLEQVLDALSAAARDPDVLVYSTVLDIHLSEPKRYTTEEREQLLGHILETLRENEKLVYEIGWDLPSLLVPYVDSDYDFKGPIRDAPCVYKVLKIFELLALHGNPKELFLKSTELLSSIKSDVPGLDIFILEKFYDVKIFCLFELVDSCLKRIETLYPLRFLAIAAAAFINAIYINPCETNLAAQFFWKRLYLFARNYKSPPTPKNPDGLPEDLARIKDDEEYLQRLLLTAFITEGINLVARRWAVSYLVDLFTYLQASLANNVEGYVVEMPVLDRLYELALSFDMELSTEFKNFVKQSNELVKEPETEDVSGLFQALMADYEATFATSLVTSSKKVVDSKFGVLSLYTHHVCTTRRFDVPFTFKDALSITFRLVVPAFVNPKLFHKGHQDLAVFWIWYVIHSGARSDVEKEIASISHTLLATFFQALLHILVTNPASPNFRFVTLTLLTRLLSLSPQGTAYSFVLDTLRNCPYENIKAALVGVFKELVTKEREGALDLAMAQLTVSETAPPLPPRDKKTYIELTSLRFAEVLALVKQSAQATLRRSDAEVVFNAQSLPTLLALLNFLISVKSLPVFVEHKSAIEDITASLLSDKSALDAQWKNDASKATLLNGVGLVGIAIDRIKA